MGVQVSCKDPKKDVLPEVIMTPDILTALPLGLTVLSNGIHVSVSVSCLTCVLVLYQAGDEAPCMRIPFPPEQRIGDVWNLTVTGTDFTDLCYCFEGDGRLFTDPCGHHYVGYLGWGDGKRIGSILTAKIGIDHFDWEGDQPLVIPYEKCIVYQAHVRGFTKHSSAKVSKKGTFQGIVEKISYLKDLGITTLELLPIIEFEEIVTPRYVQGSPYGSVQPDGKINFWGYCGGYYFAPKTAYSVNPGSPQHDFRNLVKQLHRAGIEIVIELYFTGNEVPSFVLDIARYWVREYHVDGIHFIGQIPASLIANDPYLQNTKLWYKDWEQCLKEEIRHCYLAEYSDQFMNTMRKFLKGDEDQTANAFYQIRHNNNDKGIIKFMAHTNGFTLMDMVSYDRKHNEENGENNQDGTNYNYSWNCGTEGNTRKKKIIELRKKQIRNAITLLLLSQGTPLLLAGDEFGNSQKGNNNAYCQDNEISWLNWKQLPNHQDIYQFTRYMIAFRKAHPIFSAPTQLRVMDYRSCGYPDISCHGVKAWCPEFESFRRELGIMYCGLYAESETQEVDHYFYVIYNMHWENHEFALPQIPKKRHWHMAVNTDDIQHNGIYQNHQEVFLKDQRSLVVEPRTIVVLIGK